MDGPSSADISLFEGFRLDRRGGVLSQRDEHGVFAPLAIGSRALDILGALIERPGDLVSRAEIMDAVWPGTVVEDSNLNVQVAALRRILDDGRAAGSCIQTVAGRGYRFVVPVTRAELPATASGPPAGNGRAGSIVEHGQPQSAGARTLLGATLPLPSSRARHRFWGGKVAAVIVPVILVGMVAIWNWNSPWFGEPRPVARLSIVVLPFTNLATFRTRNTSSMPSPKI